MGVSPPHCRPSQMSGGHLDLADMSLLLLSVVAEACLHLLYDPVAITLQKQSGLQTGVPFLHSSLTPFFVPSRYTEQSAAVCCSQAADCFSKPTSPLPCVMFQFFWGNFLPFVMPYSSIRDCLGFLAILLMWTEWWLLLYTVVLDGMSKKGCSCVLTNIHELW